MTSQDDATNPPATLTVYRGWKDPGKHVWSPFVVKLEARLRFGGSRTGPPGDRPRRRRGARFPTSSFPRVGMMQVVGWERWTQNYYTMRDHVLGALPYPLRVVVGLLAYRGTVATLHGQGTGRYAAEEIAAFRREIWEAVDALLTASRNKSLSQDRPKGKPFWVLGGEEPTEADATVFGFVVSALICTA
ncbi:glutathione S-transferase [Apiospora rasikravindrae]|uniref:Glutathione S-transferase n=1 Tax=Apiospora rasikravindrae TaxID=990691 RepID=A0ABR1TI41_9PEZI